MEMSDGEDFELDSDESFDFTENENDAAWMTLHVAVQIVILIAAHVHKSALFVLFALQSQVMPIQSVMCRCLDSTLHRLGCHKPEAMPAANAACLPSRW